MLKVINPPGPATTYCERCFDDFDYTSDGVSVPVFYDHCHKMGGFFAPPIPDMVRAMASKLGMKVAEIEVIYNEYMEESD